MCFKDPDARSRKGEPGKTGVDPKEQPIRVVSVSQPSAASHETATATVKANQVTRSTAQERANTDPLLVIQPSDLDFEPEPWSMGAIRRRTLQFEPQAAQLKAETLAKEAETLAKDAEAFRNSYRHASGPASASHYGNSTWDDREGIRAADLLGLPRVQRKYWSEGEEGEGETAKQDDYIRGVAIDPSHSIEIPVLKPSIFSWPPGGIDSGGRAVPVGFTPPSAPGGGTTEKKGLKPGAWGFETSGQTKGLRSEDSAGERRFVMKGSGGVVLTS